MPTSPTAAPPRGAPVWAGMLVLYLVWGSTYLAISIAVETLPPFLMAAVRFSLAGLILLAWSIAARRPLLRRAQPARMARQRHRRRAPARRRDGHGRVRRTDDPVGHHRAAHRHHAGLGRDLRSDLPRRAPAAHRDRRHRARVRGVAILVGPSAFGGTGALDPLGLAAVLISPIAWSIGSLFASHRAMLPSRPLVATGIQMVLGGARPRPDGHADRGARLGGSRLDLARIGRSPCCTCW